MSNEFEDMKKKMEEDKETVESNFFDFLGEMLGIENNGECDCPRCRAKRNKAKTVEEAFLRLKNCLDETQQENPFSVGDLVHPKEGSTYKGRGVPHIVVEKYDEIQYEVGAPAGPLRPFDLIICRMNGSDPMYYSVESYHFDAWKVGDTEEFAKTFED